MRFARGIRTVSLTIVYVIVVAILNGCAIKGSGPMFVSEGPMTGKALVIHYRVPRGYGSGAQYDVLSNGKPLTCIGNGGFFREIVEPGSIVYESKFQTRGGPFLIGRVIDNARAQFKEAYRLEAEAGKIYYLRWGLGTVPEIEQVAEKEALEQLEGLRSFQPLEMAQK